MTIHPACIGIDVSKHHLDLFDDAASADRRVANEAVEIARLVETWGGRSLLVVFEATGPYDRALREALSAAGVRFARVNPARARDFARATGRLAKTDAIDARVLAAMGRALAPAAEPAPDLERERLADLHRRRDQLVEMRACERTRLEERLDPTGSLKAHIAWLSDEIARLERLIAELLAASPGLAATASLMRSVPGVGPVTANTLLALMPELGRRSGKVVAALAGLAPMNHDSGTMRGARRIKGGRRRVRRALYMAAVTAIRKSPRFGAFYKAVLARRAAPKLALVAVARKILVTLNAMLKTNTAFRPC